MFPLSDPRKVFGSTTLLVAMATQYTIGPGINTGLLCRYATTGHNLRR